METNRSRVLSTLKRAIQKVKFLLSFDATRWIFSSSFKGGSPKRLSFKDPPGLHSIVDGYGRSPSFVVSRTSSSSSRLSRSISSASTAFSRTTSDASSTEDIDKRAEIFIANFYRNIQMERQVSLELRYCKGNTLERTRSNLS